ncbi:MAG: glycosyltransferase [Jatrophihabitantaceae bacterium]|nr:glycosyltransferase [Jatrophihabitantaceae bacterium]
MNPDAAAEIQAQIVRLAQQIEELRAGASVALDVVDGHSRHLADLSGAFGSVSAGHSAWLADLQAAADVSAARTNSHEAQLATQGETIAALPHGTVPGPHMDAGGAAAAIATTQNVWAVMRYLESPAVGHPDDVLISVVMCTVDRPASLRAAISSVLAQRHRNLELIVVDNGGGAATAAVLDAVSDSRLIRVAAGEAQMRRGAAAARNLGLSHVSGEIVAYLDDDNLMDPGWLHAVAWAFRRWPDTELLYGARIVDDGAAAAGLATGAMPGLQFDEWDRQRIEAGNYIDMNVIAHRRGLAAARFDETVHGADDWEMLLRATAMRDPLALPAIACIYRTDAADRLSERGGRPDMLRSIRSTAFTARPLRVLSHNAMFPLLSETYIHEEMLALKQSGATIAFSASQVSVSPFAIEEPIYDDLLAGVRALRPDVIFLYWATHAAEALAQLEGLGIPFAVRVHSFDYDQQLIQRIQAHPLCIGIWAYPGRLAALPGAHGLRPLFVRHEEMPDPQDVRDLVLSVSAGLPKKNWPLVFEAMDLLDDLDRHIIIARSNGMEDMPDRIIAASKAFRHPPTITVNADRSEVFALLGRTSVLTYTVDEGTQLGMPMSVIEGMRAGACIVHVDDDALRPVLGESWRPYRTASDVERHVREVMAGGPLIEEERRRNKEWALEHFCAPELRTAFHAELSQALTDWFLSR